MCDWKQETAPIPCSRFLKGMILSRTVFPLYRKYRGPRKKKKKSIEGEASIQTSKLFSTSSLKRLIFQPCFAQPQGKRTATREARGMCPNYAFIGSLTFHWEILVLREVSFFPRIISNLCVILCSIRTGGFGCSLLVSLHSTAKGVEKSFLFPRQPQKLLMLITQHPATFSAHLGMRQCRHHTAWKVCCSLNPNIHTSTQTFPTNLSYLRLGNGFPRCAGIFQLSSSKHLPHG